MTTAAAPAKNAIEIQRRYYAETADHYDDFHGDEHVEHNFALQLMVSAAKYLGLRSILDIGSGTGRALMEIKRALPDVTVIGVEPSPELRKIGHSKGLSEVELVDGDGMQLALGDGAFDLVCEFGALHHIPLPSKAVSEMLRVSRKAIFISDSNNFGQGSGLSRFVKQAFNAAGLWPLLDKIKTKGKGYTISEGDGLAYSYSVFNDYRQIRASCSSVHLFNALSAGPNLYRTAPHVALLGLRQPIKTMIATAGSSSNPDQLADSTSTPSPTPHVDVQAFKPPLGHRIQQCGDDLFIVRSPLTCLCRRPW